MKKIMCTMLFLGGCATTSIQPSAVGLCTQTVRDYAILRDNGPTTDYVELFTTDGEFHLGDDITKGHLQLRLRHQRANKSTQWRHNMTDIRIEEKDGVLTGSSRFHIFAGQFSTKPTIPTREILGDYNDLFQVQDGKCKIQSRKVKVIFDKGF